MRERRSRVLRDARAIVAVGLTATTPATAVFLGVSGLLPPVKHSPLHLADFPRDHVTVGGVVFTAIFVVLSALRGKLAASAGALWLFASFASLSLVQGWYVLYLYPPALLVASRSQSWLASWALGLIYLLNWLPSVYLLVNDLLVRVP